MRELNKFNQIVIEKFASRQAYRNIKGHYIPIIMGDISDESVMEIEKRKYYIQNYSFTMLGFLIDEDEFEVSPAVSRVIQIMEIDQTKKRRLRPEKQPGNKSSLEFLFSYSLGVTSLTETFYYNGDFLATNLDNISSYDVYINNEFYGSNQHSIQLNDKDELRIDIVKDDITKVSKIEFQVKLL